MAGKAEILRALEGLPQDSLKEIKEFIDSLKKQNGKRHAIGRNEELLAKKQLSAIKKWAGRTLKEGFSGGEHDTVLYVRDSAW
jgi:Fe-S cluster assembly ATPase SufC